jgi:hypothetical protein
MENTMKHQLLLAALLPVLLPRSLLMRAGNSMQSNHFPPGMRGSPAPATITE